MLDAGGDARTQRWRVGLHNNAGWARFDAEDYAGAVTEFELAKDAATRWGTPQQIAWADEALDEEARSRALSSPRRTDPDELLVDELVRREKAHLARGARALHAAERQLRRVGEHDVDVDHAGVDLVGDARSLRLVGREDVRPEPERRVVRDRDRLVLVRDLVDDADRAEELLAVRIHVGRDVRRAPCPDRTRHRAFRR